MNPIKTKTGAYLAIIACTLMLACTPSRSMERSPITTTMIQIIQDKLQAIPQLQEYIKINHTDFHGTDGERTLAMIENFLNTLKNTMESSNPDLKELLEDMEKIVQSKDSEKIIPELHSYFKIIISKKDIEKLNINDIANATCNSFTQDLKVLWNAALDESQTTPSQTPSNSVPVQQPQENLANQIQQLNLNSSHQGHGQSPRPDARQSHGNPGDREGKVTELCKELENLNELEKIIYPSDPQLNTLKEQKEEIQKQINALCNGDAPLMNHDSASVPQEDTSSDEAMALALAKEEVKQAPRDEQDGNRRPNNQNSWKQFGKNAEKTAKPLFAKLFNRLNITSESFEGIDAGGNTLLEKALKSGKKRAREGQQLDEQDRRNQGRDQR
jgi:hypothetical protein